MDFPRQKMGFGPLPGFLEPNIEIVLSYGTLHAPGLCLPPHTFTLKKVTKKTKKFSREHLYVHNIMPDS